MFVQNSVQHRLYVTTTHVQADVFFLIIMDQSGDDFFFLSKPMFYN